MEKIKFLHSHKYCSHIDCLCCSPILVIGKTWDWVTVHIWLLLGSCCSTPQYPKHTSGAVRTRSSASAASRWNPFWRHQNQYHSTHSFGDCGWDVDCIWRLSPPNEAIRLQRVFTRWFPLPNRNIEVFSFWREFSKLLLLNHESFCLEIQTQVFIFQVRKRRHPNHRECRARRNCCRRSNKSCSSRSKVQTFFPPSPLRSPLNFRTVHVFRLLFSGLVFALAQAVESVLAYTTARDDQVAACRCNSDEFRYIHNYSLRGLLCLLERGS